MFYKKKIKELEERINQLERACFQARLNRISAYQKLGMVSSGITIKQHKLYDTNKPKIDIIKKDVDLILDYLGVEHVSEEVIPEKLVKKTNKK